MGSLSKFMLDKDVDSVTAHQGGTWTVDTITNDVNIADGGNSITVDATDLDIRDLAYATDSVTAHQGGTWNIGTLTSITNDVNIADGGNSITVDATDLDIRDLTHASDSVKIGDGTDFLVINGDGSINVVGSLTVDDRQNTANLPQAVGMSDVPAALPASPLANRERLHVANVGSEIVYLGPSGVTSASGYPLYKGDAIEVNAGPSNVVYGVCASEKTSTVRIWELS